MVFLKKNLIPQASKRITTNLKDALDSKFIDNTKLMSKIAGDMAEAGRTVPAHPLGF